MTKTEAALILRKVWEGQKDGRLGAALAELEISSANFDELQREMRVLTRGLIAPRKRGERGGFFARLVLVPTGGMRRR